LIVYKLFSIYKFTGNQRDAFLIEIESFLHCIDKIAYHCMIFQTLAIWSYKILSLKYLSSATSTSKDNCQKSLWQMFNFLVFIFHTLLVGNIYYALFHRYRMTDQNMAEFGLVSLSMFGLSVYVWSLCLCLVSVSLFGLCVYVWSRCLCFLVILLVSWFSLVYCYPCLVCLVHFISLIDIFYEWKTEFN